MVELLLVDYKVEPLVLLLVEQLVELVEFELDLFEVVDIPFPLEDIATFELDVNYFDNYYFLVYLNNLDLHFAYYYKYLEEYLEHNCYYLHLTYIEVDLNTFLSFFLFIKIILF